MQQKRNQENCVIWILLNPLMLSTLLWWKEEYNYIVDIFHGKRDGTIKAKACADGWKWRKYKIKIQSFVNCYDGIYVIRSEQKVVWNDEKGIFFLKEKMAALLCMLYLRCTENITEGTLRYVKKCAVVLSKAEKRSWNIWKLEKQVNDCDIFRK